MDRALQGARLPFDVAEVLLPFLCVMALPAGRTPAQRVSQLAHRLLGPLRKIRIPGCACPSRLAAPACR